MRVLGVTLAVIGWLYMAGGTRSSSFALATVLDRALIPVVLLPLAAMHVAPLGIVLPFSILDPVLGAGAYLIWRTQRSREAAEVRRAVVPPPAGAESSQGST